MTSMDTRDMVVLLDDAGTTIGTASKSEIHHGSTPLHLAFSCYLFDDAGWVLLTRRAVSKKTFPGIWTNSCCGHPAPGESIDAAVRRRVSEELGVGITALRCVLPDFRYVAVAADGIVENEVCPVFCARVTGPVRADREEVADYTWVPWDHLRAAAGLGWAISPWAVKQVPLLAAEGIGQGCQDLSS
ncbi:isopentenyl-diphosphate Delta-isomerase [Mycobacterium sp. Y57]|uniref:isopentenyl-diphosphate Delta-isomerase n=1 Tax=Mycolicibacterium xanthum TaxID=2796469 RepID=UPI001C847A87|nr:isopentenyl-diphosphate Delta-isomerase [Mycolicibacterium xanthum]MBX7433032.1 isopentenyl-diphosphate Delta-isomerase [Mycolicibacterium xanthum]